MIFVFFPTPLAQMYTGVSYAVSMTVVRDWLSSGGGQAERLPIPRLLSAAVCTYQQCQSCKI
jgi:hypothetical protein